MTHHGLIFLHIPKTAGTTVDVVLRRQYAPGEVIRFSSFKNGVRAFEEIPKHVRASARLVKGHVHFGVHRYLEGHWDYATILREPIARVVSVYRYIRAERLHPFHETVMRRDMGLEEFVESGIGWRGTNNGQTRQVAGIEGRAVVDDRALDLAIENLRKYFVVVGIQEKLDESLLLLKRKCSWHMSLYVSRNVSGGTVPRLSAREQRLIETNNELDIALYDYAAKRLAAELDEQRFFSAELATTRLLNRTISVWARTRQLPKPLRETGRARH